MRELSLHILDVLQNSVEAGASRIKLTISEDMIADRLTIIVEDNGRGMDKERVKRAVDPFYTTRRTRHVGLGLPLFAAAAEQCSGSLTLESELGKGTKLQVVFQHSHIDRAPIGDICSSLLTVLLSESQVDLHYLHTVNDRRFEFDTAEIRTELGDVPISHPTVRDWLREFITQGEREISAMA
ncbi:ATP-binding protein [Candidatus Acetothermia bacterium]|jgi:signal transduction histidine kinase|nr:ATP-binding protein [Candidatus Acetothermia bacterium]MCI2427241.1 ATP-binding protein [Candidatus Acetothermia bacterium]MCI2428753.1 ATP-binding protein [Candidatus Acetothermia bacterium]